MEDQKENDISNKEENELINKYKKFEFNNLGEQSKENLYNLNEIKTENLYLIQKTDFDKGISYLQELSKFKNDYKNKHKVNSINYITKINGIVKGNKTDFCLVGEEFLKSLEIDKENYKEKNVNFFEFKERKYILFEGKNILEITKSEKVFEDDIKENVLKKLILIYGYEKNYDKLFESSIKDEYDINGYYLINKNWIEKYKSNNYYKDVSNILEKAKYDFSFKGFCFNLENILKTNDFANVKKRISASTNNYISNEENFYPRKNKKSFKKIKDIEKDIYCPYEFILIPEFLFDLFYSEINKSENSSKDDYKYNILINDKVVFIQDNKINSIYYTFFVNQKLDLDLYYLFYYDEDITFFNEVKQYIKDKKEGFLNYIAERNINYNKETLIYKELDKQEEDEKKSKYINFQNLGRNDINKINTLKIKKILNENEELLSMNNKFWNSVKKLNDKGVKTPNYNDIIKNFHNNKFDILQVGIVLASDINKLNNNLYFNELEKLSDLKEKEKEEVYEKIKEETIKRLSKNYKDIDIFDIVSKIKLFNPEDIDNDKKYKNQLGLINIDLLEEINKSKEFSESILECFYFKNNGEEYILYPKENKLYMIGYIKDNSAFHLIELYTNLGIIINNLKGLEENEENIKKKLKLPLKELSDPEEYYCINNEWIEEYKNLYNYKKIIKNKNNNEQTLYSYINAEKISDFLIDNKNLIPNLIEGTDYYTDFCFINKNLCESIIKDINKSNNINLKLENSFQILFGGNRIFLKNNKYSYFIYSINLLKYKLDYILNIKNKKNIKEFLSDYETFDEFIKKNEINLPSDEEKKTKDFTIKAIIENKVAKININDKYKKNKTFKNNSNQIQTKKEPNHCLGLENIGATCYMNATIQCLCHITNVKNYFQNQQLVNSDTYNKNCELTREFNKLLNELWKEPSGNKNYYTPTDFKNCISRMNPLFKGIAANDSKDLIIFLYETMHNEINKEGQYNCNNMNDDLAIFRNNYYSNNSSFLIDTFYFEQQSELCCMNCGSNKISYNIANIIIFPLEKVKEYVIRKNAGRFDHATLENCFEYYQEKESLSNANQIFCNACQTMSNATTGNKLFTCPQVMTIILNRGKGLEFNVDFEYPPSINIEKYVILEPSYGETYNYELIGVLSHYGESSMSGHFIAHCKSPVDGKWYCYNDAIVTPTNVPKSQNKGNFDGIPYVLFYQRTDLVKPKISNNNTYPRQSFSNNNTYQKKSFSNNNYKAEEEDIDDKNDDSNNIYLYYYYNDIEDLIEVDENIKIKDLINKLKSECTNIPSNFSLYFQTEDNILELENYRKTIKDYGIQNGSKLTIIEKA